MARAATETAPRWMRGRAIQLLKTGRRWDCFTRKLTGTVIGLALKVYNRMGYGFLENPYVGALELELRRAGIRVAREDPIAVQYDGVIVSTYRMDLLIDGKLVFETKAEARLNPMHERQLRNYLQASSIELGLLFNFGPKPEFRRFIHPSVDPLCVLGLDAV